MAGTEFSRVGEPIALAYTADPREAGRNKNRCISGAGAGAIAGVRLQRLRLPGALAPDTPRAIRFRRTCRVSRHRAQKLFTKRVAAGNGSRPSSSSTGLAPTNGAPSSPRRERGGTCETAEAGLTRQTMLETCGHLDTQGAWNRAPTSAPHPRPSSREHPRALTIRSSDLRSSCESTRLRLHRRAGGRGACDHVPMR